MSELHKSQWDDLQRQIERIDPYARNKREQREYEEFMQQWMRAQEQQQRKSMWSIFSRKGRSKF